MHSGQLSAHRMREIFSFVAKDEKTDTPQGVSVNDFIQGDKNNPNLPKMA